VKAVGKLIGVLLGLLAMFAFGFSWRDIQKLEVPSADSFLALVGADTNRKASMSSVQIFRTSYHRIIERFAGKVDPKDLKYAGMEGMMAALGDPHTLFLEPKDSEVFSTETTGKFVGIGARLSPDPLGARVAVVFVGGPADQAGVKVGDYIVGVEGKSVEGVDIGKIVDRIRGPEGTMVTLKLTRPGKPQPFSLQMRRASVIVPTVSGLVLEGTSIGLVTVDSFSETTGQQFDAVLARLEAQEIKGLIVDVRGNPGGLLDTARDLLSHFIDDKVVVKMRMRGGKEEVVPSFSGKPDLVRFPTVVLIDSDSASAAEIFAGVLKDYRLATLVGETTYGKSAVQNVFKLRDTASAKITIAKYLLPSGLDVGRKVDADGQFVSGGLKPDIEIEQDENTLPVPADPSTDRQLTRAIEVLKTKLGVASATPSLKWSVSGEVFDA
jgi:carboxyl-terminal processing protease